MHDWFKRFMEKAVHTITKPVNRIPGFLMILAIMLLAFAGSFVVYAADEPDYQALAKGLLSKTALKTTYVKSSGGARIDFVKAAGQKVRGYAVFQGSCARGGYSYHVLYHKKKNKCRLIKVDAASGEVVKVSKPYKISHGNDMAYDTKRDRILVVHGDGDTMRVSVFDPETLKRKSVVKLKMPRKLPGANAAFIKKFKGITGIAYDEARDEFIASVKSTFHYIVLSPKLKPKRLIKVKTKGNWIKQGMLIADGKIIRVMNRFKKNAIKNYLFIYDRKGKYIKRIRIKNPGELESVYFANSGLYGAVYFEKGKGKRFKQADRIVKIG